MNTCDGTIAKQISVNITNDLVLEKVIGDDQRRLTRYHFTAAPAELRELMIYGSRAVDTIEPGAFDHMTSVINIILEETEIRSLPSGLLSKLDNLRKFHITDHGSNNGNTAEPVPCQYNKFKGDLFVMWSAVLASGFVCRVG